MRVCVGLTAGLALLTFPVAFGMALVADEFLQTLDLKATTYFMALWPAFIG